MSRALPVELVEQIVEDTLVMSRYEGAKHYETVNKEYNELLISRLGNVITGPDRWMLLFKVFKTAIVGGPHVGVFFELMHKYFKVDVVGARQGVLL